ncbi:hypothetical protein BDR03DRAFT_1009041 [Suillus americanus]|nr:hypothetical protein BDR03DRAFT_1009041 [Suillus americanus]
MPSFGSSDASSISRESLSDVKGYASSDVFVKHPTVKESTIATDLYVNDTAMFSRGRNHVGILIESRAGHEIDVDDETRLGEFRNGVWRLLSPAGSMTFIGDRYEKVEGSTRAGINVPLLTNWTTDDVESWLMIHVAAVNTANVADTFLLKALTVYMRHPSDTASLAPSGHWIVTSRHQCRSSRKSFSNPSNSRFAGSVINAISSRNGPSAVDSKTDIENMIKKYSVGFGSSARDDSLL